MSDSKKPPDESGNNPAERKVEDNTDIENNTSPEPEPSDPADDPAQNDTPQEPRRTVDPLFDRPPPSRAFRIVRRILLVLIAFSILLLGGVSILSLVGGKDDSLKEGLEKFFHDYTGLKTTIGTLNDLQIYPVLHMDIENVKADGATQESTVQLTARRIVVGMTFWDAVFSRGWIAASSIEDLYAPAGLLTPRALNIDSLAFEGEGRDARLAVRGSYNAVPFALSVGMRTRPYRRGPLYRISDLAPFTLTLGKLTFQGQATQPKDRKGMDFPTLSVFAGNNGAPLASGNGALVPTPEGLRLDINLRTAPDGPESSELIVRLHLSEDGLPSGHLALPVVRPKDLSPQGVFTPLFALARDLIRPAATTSPGIPAQTTSGEQNSGTMAFILGTPEGLGKILPPKPDVSIRCAVGKILVQTDTIRIENLTVYGEDGRPIKGTGDLSMANGSIKPGWNWSAELPNPQEDWADIQALIPPSTPCANLPKAPAP